MRLKKYQILVAALLLHDFEKELKKNGFRALRNISSDTEAWEFIVEDRDQDPTWTVKPVEKDNFFSFNFFI